MASRFNDILHIMNWLCVFFLSSSKYLLWEHVFSCRNRCLKWNRCRCVSILNKLLNKNTNLSRYPGAAMSLLQSRTVGLAICINMHSHALLQASSGSGPLSSILSRFTWGLAKEAIMRAYLIISIEMGSGCDPVGRCESTNAPISTPRSSRYCFASLAIIAYAM